MSVIHEVRLVRSYTTSTNSYLLLVFFEGLQCHFLSSHPCSIPGRGIGAFLLSNADLVSSAGLLLSVTLLDGTSCFLPGVVKLALAPLLSGWSNLPTSTRRASGVMCSSRETTTEPSATCQPSRNAMVRRCDLPKRGTQHKSSDKLFVNKRPPSRRRRKFTRLLERPLHTDPKTPRLSTKQSTRRFPRPRSTSPRMNEADEGFQFKKVDVLRVPKTVREAFNPR